MACSTGRDNKAAVTLAEIVILTGVPCRATCQHWRHQRCAYRQDPGRCHRAAGAAARQSGAASARRIGGCGDPGAARRQGARRLGISECLRRKIESARRDGGLRVLVCADDAAARQSIIELVHDMGLRGIDAGPICNSAAAEALTSVLIWINRKYGVPGSGIRIAGLRS